MRDVVCIYTGQGAAGNLRQIGIYTGQFSTCSPVLMFNEKTGMGGLYHLPGKLGDPTKLRNDEWSNLKALLRLIRPTLIRLYPCGNYALRQGFVAGQESNVYAPYTEEDMEDANGRVSVAKGIAFDRYYKGDQRELNSMFAKTKAATVMGYDVQLSPVSVTGILVTADDNGQLEERTGLTGLGGTTYDVSKRMPPKELCVIINPGIDYSLWMKAD